MSSLARNLFSYSTTIRTTGIRLLKTSSTHHPEPMYDQELKVLDKIIQERGEDLPVSLNNPFEKPPRKCILCHYGIQPDYKNTKLLAQFVSPYTGMLYGPHVTGLCKEMYRRVEKERLKAIRYGLMPDYLKDLEYLKDPKLCDIEKPLKPHKY